MEAKEPCIGCPRIRKDEYGYLCDIACGERTAWRNYMAGIKLVVEWIEERLERYKVAPKLIGFTMLSEEWQDFKKECGL